MIHYAHPVTSGPACISSDNTRTTKDLVVTGLTFVRDHVTCQNCLVDVDDTQNVTNEAAWAQNRSAGYDPMGFPHVSEDVLAIFPDPAIVYTVVILPTICEGDATKRDTPQQPGFAIKGFQHFTTGEAVVFAEREAGPDGYAVVYPLTAFPRHLPAHRPIAYYYRATWHKAV